MRNLFSAVSTHAGRKATHGPSGPGSRTGRSVLGAGMRVEGVIASSGAVRIDGTVVGDVRCESRVLVARGGRVEGDIRAAEVLSNGEVKGAILAEHRAELQPSSVVAGRVVSRRLVVQEGSRITGRLRTGEQAFTQDHDVGELPTAGAERGYSDTQDAAVGSLRAPPPAP